MFKFKQHEAKIIFHTGNRVETQPESIIDMNLVKMKLATYRCLLYISLLG